MAVHIVVKLSWPEIELRTDQLPALFQKEFDEGTFDVERRHAVDDLSAAHEHNFFGWAIDEVLVQRGAMLVIWYNFTDKERLFWSFHSAGPPIRYKDGARMRKVPNYDQAIRAAWNDSDTINAATLGECGCNICIESAHLDKCEDIFRRAIVGESVDPAVAEVRIYREPEVSESDLSESSVREPVVSEPVVQEPVVQESESVSVGWGKYTGGKLPGKRTGYQNFVSKQFDNAKQHMQDFALDYEPGRMVWSELGSIWKQLKADQREQWKAFAKGKAAEPVMTLSDWNAPYPKWLDEDSCFAAPRPSAAFAAAVRSERRRVEAVEDDAKRAVAAEAASWQRVAEAATAVARAVEVRVAQAERREAEQPVVYDQALASLVGWGEAAYKRDFPILGDPDPVQMAPLSDTDSVAAATAGQHVLKQEEPHDCMRQVVNDYLIKHNLTFVLGEAINAAIAAHSNDPSVFIADFLYDKAGTVRHQQWTPEEWDEWEAAHSHWTQEEWSKWEAEQGGQLAVVVHE